MNEENAVVKKVNSRMTEHGQNNVCCNVTRMIHKSGILYKFILHTTTLYIGCYSIK